MDNEENARKIVAIVGILFLGCTISSMDHRDEWAYNITNDDILNNSCISLCDGEVKLLVKDKEVRETAYEESYRFNEEIKDYEQKHNHYEDIINGEKLVDNEDCYINKLASKYPKLYYKRSYMNIEIVDELEPYLTDFEKLLIKEGDYSSEDAQKTLDRIMDNPKVISKLERLEENSEGKKYTYTNDKKDNIKSED